MHRSVFLFLISCLVLSAALALPASQEESQEEDSQLTLKVESVEDAQASVSSSEEKKDEAKDKVKSSNDSFSAEEELQSEEISQIEEGTAARFRRSAEEEKFRNLYILATICPQNDFRDLEDDPALHVRIEIRDMYAICAQLKDRQRI